ncbi:sugar transferase [Polymorphum gilvum]|uniref:Bacterial sugar transferase, putative n=1 Tax=Polymorphum gilvum (strain LMG 25793 / CGMCC 1.9160 / SL003B-26A1) TaxID=991905 RepID=F2IW86_POLGS|nr:sugar transferase [Polymorphum gilvum]ADZ71471.1 Bacterial sugar transferase, putative [Polymorphum gilvum SL003B-26A1]
MVHEYVVTQPASETGRDRRKRTLFGRFAVNRQAPGALAAAAPSASEASEASYRRPLTIGRSVAGSAPKAPRLRPAVKRTVDIAGSSAGLVLLSPLLLGIAVAVKASSRGPVIFRQARYGLDGKLFYTLKFRSMYVDRQDASGVAQTRKNDPRVTPVGRFLRQSNFDELPQLWNVLKGDMSLVGPRPHVPGMLAAGVPYEQFDSAYMDRHKVKPGITGLAQVNGFRGETTEDYAARMRLHYDLQYVAGYSNRLDLKILFRTFWQEFLGGSGY